MKFEELTISQAHQGLKKKDFSCIELAKFFLERISQLDKEIFSFLTITSDPALSEAKKIDDMILEKREISPLAGIPLAVKDIILVEGVKCTAASKILENYIAPYNATVIRKLKEKGAVILGKTNLDEFAMGSSTENSAFKITKNPNDITRVPGGSSGGSAAAVAANFCIYALGSDTGGSIRQPASFCGVVGLKPTYGAVSRYGLISMASSLDQIGPITKTVEDCQIVFEAISGKDSLDSTSVELNLKSEILNLKSIKIGVPKEYFVEGMDKEVEKIIKNSIKKIEEQGLKIEEISLPHTEYALACYYVIMPSEVSANLARFDGIKYGFSKITNHKSPYQSKLGTGQAQITNLLNVYLKSREEGFGKEVRRRIALGTYALSAGYYEAYYLRAQKVRTKIKEDFEKAFKIVDLILTPVSPTPAFKIGEKIEDPLKMYLSDIFTIAVNLAGLPALSLPVGKIDNLPRTTSKKNRLDQQTTQQVVRGLPVGLQIIARPFEENKIFQLGQIIEKLS